MKIKNNWVLCLFFALLFTHCSESRLSQRKRHFLHKGNLSYKEKMYQDAIRYYNEAIEVDSTFAQAYNNLGIVYLKTGKLDKALIAYNHSIKYAPGIKNTYYNRSNILYEMGEFEKSLDDLNRIQNNYSDQEAIHFLKGLSFFNLRQYDSADYSFKNALDLDVTNIENYLNLASTKYYKNEFEAAKELVLQCLKLDNTSADAYNILGMAYSKQGDDEKAFEAYNEGLKYESNNAYILNNRGFLYLLQDDLKKALLDINESISINHTNPWAYRNKGVYFYKTGEYKNALRLLRQSIQMDEWIELSHYYIGKIHLDAGDISKACSAFHISAQHGEEEGEKAYQQYCR